MASLLGGSYPLEGGTRVRLRLARSSDARALCDLLPDIGVARLVHFDPRHSCVLCATALIDGRETLVGVGAIAVGAQTPELVVADERLPGLGPLLSQVLLTRAASMAYAA